MTIFHFPFQFKLHFHYKFHFSSCFDDLKIKFITINIFNYSNFNSIYNFNISIQFQFKYLNFSLKIVFRYGSSKSPGGKHVTITVRETKTEKMTPVNQAHRDGELDKPLK